MPRRVREARREIGGEGEPLVKAEPPHVPSEWTIAGVECPILDDRRSTRGVMTRCEELSKALEEGDARCWHRIVTVTREREAKHPGRKGRRSQREEIRGR